MKKEFIVERQGRSFVLYAGLLSLAHENGLKSITTELVQAPTEANKGVCICTARVVMEKDGVERVFTGIGDAAVNNVAPAMALCLIRMAETRAKARALRDAVNVGVAAFEELGDEGAHDGAPDRGYASGPARSASRPSQATARPAAVAKPPREEHNPHTSGITEAQAKAIKAMCLKRNLDADQVAAERFEGAVLEALTEAQAGDVIRSLTDPRSKAA